MGRLGESVDLIGYFVTFSGSSWLHVVCSIYMCAFSIFENFDRHITHQ